jgi:hypothetical protein
MEEFVYHILYKVTCLLTNKYYVGMHSTSNLNDGYLGSGKILLRSLKKHGKENHFFEILETFPSRDCLIAREIEVVSEELLADPLSMNLMLGGKGGGGWTNVNNNPERHKASSQRGRESMAVLRNSDPVWEAQRKANLEKTQRRANTPEAILKMKATIAGSGPRVGPQYNSCWVNKSGEALRIQKEELESYLSQGYSRGLKPRDPPKYKKSSSTEGYRGSNNSQFGTCWVTKEGKDKKIKKEDLQEYLDEGFVRGRKNGNPPNPNTFGV